jgi:ATP-dependent DNA ligase
MTTRPMPLVRVAEPFDYPDWLFELKHDGFRALAVTEAGRCVLVSRNGNELKHWPQLTDELAATVRAKQVRVSKKALSASCKRRHT